MLLSVMRECKNFFEITSESGKFEIKNGVILLSDDYLIGQHICVTGSILNNGAYLLNDTLYTLSGSRDEIFYGTVYGLAVPRDFIALAQEIDEYVAKNPASNMTSYSFGISSASYATNEKGMQATWMDVFRQRLNKYRMMFKQIPL